MMRWLDSLLNWLISDEYAYETGETLPPPTVCCGAYWERGRDPFHPEAFGMPITNPSVNWPRQTGWKLIDLAGQVTGFVPDGTRYNEPPVNYDIRLGEYGRMCAYPVSAG